MFSSRIFKPQTALQWFIRTLRSVDSDGSETSLKKVVLRRLNISFFDALAYLTFRPDNNF